MAKRKATKRVNKADATLRNVRAANKQITDLERRMTLVEAHIEIVFHRTDPTQKYDTPVGNVVD